MIVVAGESLIDLVPTGDGGIRAVPGGGPYNVARTIARLAESCAYLGSLSTDGFGQTRRRTRRENLLVRPGAQTWCAIRDSNPEPAD